MVDPAVNRPSGLPATHSWWFAPSHVAGLSTAGSPIESLMDSHRVGRWSQTAALSPVALALSCAALCGHGLKEIGGRGFPVPSGWTWHGRRRWIFHGWCVCIWSYSLPIKRNIVVLSYRVTMWWCLVIDQRQHLYGQRMSSNVAETFAVTAWFVYHFSSVKCRWLIGDVGINALSNGICQHW